MRDGILDLGRHDRMIVGKDIQKVEFGWPIGMPSCRPAGLWGLAFMRCGATSRTAGFSV